MEAEDLYSRASCVSCGKKFEGLRSRAIQDCSECRSEDCLSLRKAHPDIWKQAWASLEKARETEPGYYISGLDFARSEFHRIMDVQESATS